MRPSILVMTAFGSYRDRTVIDFNQLTSDLYLITGDTGAGKTTIFDAIVYALYGTFSGSERKPEMMHSDFADKSTDMKVELTFTEQGKQYRVERSLHFRKNQKTKEYDCSNGKKAILYDADGQVLAEKETSVTARCEEITGLNADQFTKIVMLAQGQFRRFLSAGSDERQKILGKLFDDTACRAFETLLENARKELFRQRQTAGAALTSTMEAFLVPEGLSDEERAGFLPGDPDLLLHLSDLVRKDQKRAEDAGKALDEAGAAVLSLTEKKTLDQQVKQNFDDLAALNQRLESLKKQAPEIERQKEENDRIDLALHRVLPLILQRNRDRDEDKKVQEAIASLTKSCAELSARVSACDAAVKGDAEVSRKVLDLAAKIRGIDDSMGDYDDLETREKALKALETRQESDLKKLDQLKKNIETNENALKQMKEARDLLKDAPADKEKASFALEEAGKKLDAAKDVKTRLQSIREKEKELDLQKDTLQKKTQEAGRLATEANDLYQKFLASQAAILGMELENTLEKEGNATCPVCGAHFVKGQEHHFAAGTGEITRQKVDSARKKADTAEKERGNLESAFQAAKSRLAAEKDSLLSDYRKLVPEAAMEQLLQEEEVDRTMTALQEAFAAAEKEEKKAAERAAAYGKALAGIEKYEPILDDQKKNEKRGEEIISGQRADISEQAGQIRGKKEKLPYKEKADAVRERQTLDDTRRNLQSEIDQHIALQKKALEAYNSESGKLNTRKEEAPVRAKRLAAAQEEMEKSITSCGFSNEQEVLVFTTAPYGEEMESYLKKRRQSVTDFENERKNTIQKRDELAGKCEGRQMPDLEADEKALLEAKERQAKARKETEEAAGIRQSHEGTRKAAASKVQELAKTDRAYAILDRLGSLAGGANAEGGQVSFDRFVLSSTFEEVLRMANVRLDTMTGGRYELVRRESGRARNAKAGLDISIIDHRTGLERDTATISGGEGFEASLCLALGLSDVVQRKAGGRRIEALFVDEGFGTLDDEKLDNAVTVLKGLTGGGKLVGVISHVDRLREAIPTQIEVTSTGKSGSHVAMRSV